MTEKIKGFNPSAIPRAFPSDYTVGTTRYINEGVTIRDYFAAKAMQAFIPVQCGEWPGDEVIARYAYEVADAMLKARHD